MKWLVWVCALLLWPLVAASQGMNKLSVDQDGKRVALAGAPSVWSGGKSESRLFRRGDQGWTEAGTVATPGWQRIEFIGEDLLLQGRRHSFVDGRLEPRGEAISSGQPLFAQGDSGPIVRGNHVLVGIEEFPRSPLRLVKVDGDGWKSLAELQPPADLPWIIGPMHVAFDEQRVAVLLMPMMERCGLLIYEAEGEGWKRTGPLFPEVCRDGAQLGGGSISLEGERIVIGAYPHPNPEGRAGQLALFERGSGDWAEKGRIQRPTIEDDYTEDGMLPYAFGHRVQLVGGRIHAGTGYQIIRSHTEGIGTEASVVHNGVIVFAEKDGGWTVERHLVHAHATAAFGEYFEVRGDRLFIDSPFEEAAYVFVREDAGYRMESRLPAEQADPDAEHPGRGSETGQAGAADARGDG